MTDRTLNALRRKLEQWELANLRQHCTELAERLERAEARAADAEYLAESWRENAFQLQRDLMDDVINGRHTITSQRPLAGWFPIVLRVPQTIRHQEPTCAN